MPNVENTLDYFAQFEDEPSLSFEEIEKVVHGIGYRILPTEAHYNGTCHAMQKAKEEGKLKVPSLAMAVLSYALDYNRDSPFPPYSITTGDAAVFGLDGRELVAQRGLDYLPDPSKSEFIPLDKSPAEKKALAELKERYSKLPDRGVSEARQRLKAERPFPYDGTHTGWLALAIAHERGIDPQSHEASVLAHDEVKIITKALDKARAEIDAPVREKIKGIV